MERVKKKELMKERIMCAAYYEFNRGSYATATLSTISEKAKISKGIAYHYFKNKDDLYLCCVKECFDALCDYLEKNVNELNDDVLDYVGRYFSFRNKFLKKHDQYRNLFYNNIFSPPAHLTKEIEEILIRFDEYNNSLFENIFAKYPLKDKFTVEKAQQHIKMYQNGIYATFYAYGNEFKEEVYEQACMESIEILLSGLLK